MAHETLNIFVTYFSVSKLYIKKADKCKNNVNKRNGKIQKYKIYFCAINGNKNFQ